MKQRYARQHAIDTLAVKLRWVLIAAGGLLCWGRTSPWLILGVCVGLAATNAYATRISLSPPSYRRNGAEIISGLRLLDGILASAAAFAHSHEALPLWLIGLPIVCFEALSSRSSRRAGVFAGIFLGVDVIGTVVSGHPVGAAFGAIVVLGSSPLMGLVLATYRSREETLDARDRRLGALMSSASALAGSQDLQSMIIRTVKAAVRDLGATAGYVSIVSEDDPSLLIVEAAYGVDGEYEFPRTIAVGSGVSGYVAKMGQPISIHDNGGDPLECDGVSLRIRSAVSVPISSRTFGAPGQASTEQIIGALTLVNSESSETIQTEDMELLRSLSSLIATAVISARIEERRRTTFLRTMESLATALEARDDYTRGHSQRVCELSLLIGQSLGFSSDALEELRVGTVLHDIGKIGVPDAILNKPGRLTDEEFDIMKSHPVIGYEICKPLMLSEGVLLIIRNHHEKLDGSGYPDGLKGGELPLSLRIVCVADAFDAMSSRRPYRGVMDISVVLGELSKGAGVQFDPVVVECIRSLLVSGSLNEMYSAYWDTGEELAA